MIDLHCHLLPGVDDGPGTMAETLDLARAHVAAGTTTVVATSHVSWDYPENGPDTLLPLVHEVRKALADHGIPLQVLSGAEIALTRAVEIDDADLVRLRLGGGHWLLAECPLSPAAAGSELILRELVRRGHRVVLAHPERSPLFQRSPHLLETLVAEGLLTSVTATAFTGRFGRSVQRLAHDLLRRGLCHSVASDAHDRERRAPGTAPVLLDAGIAEPVVAWLCRDVPAAMLRGQALPPRPEAAPRTGGVLGRVRRPR